MRKEPKAEKRDQPAAAVWFKRDASIRGALARHEEYLAAKAEDKAKARGE